MRFPVLLLGVGLVVVAGLGATRPVAHSSARQEEQGMKKLTPILVVDAIEPCLSFWTDRLGFARTAEVPEGDHLGFVILQRDGVEVMYQTRSGIAADLPAVAAEGAGSHNLLFVEVADVDDVARRLEGVEVVVPMRKTFYGSRELFVRAPCGSIVGFAQFGEE